MLLDNLSDSVIAVSSGVVHDNDGSGSWIHLAIKQ